MDMPTKKDIKDYIKQYEDAFRICKDRIESNANGSELMSAYCGLLISGTAQIQLRHIYYDMYCKRRNNLIFCGVICLAIFAGFFLPKLQAKKK